MSMCFVYQFNYIVQTNFWSLKIVGEWHASSESLREGAEPLSKEDLGCHGISNQVL